MEEAFNKRKLFEFVSCGYFCVGFFFLLLKFIEIKLNRY